MGLRGWLSGLLDPAGGDEEAEGGQLDLVVDVERRAGTIMEHYDLSGEDARQVAEILASELAREEGYARQMIADRLAREVDIDEDRARELVDTEVASIRNLARVRHYTAQTEGEVRFRWLDSVGRDDSPICADIRAAIDEDGPVTLSELEALIRETAAEYESGTPDRADDLVPHEGCRHTVVRHVDQ
jgi:uncharacterized protein YcaQ